MIHTAILAATLGMTAFAASYETTSPSDTGDNETGNTMTKISSPYINPVSATQTQPSVPFVVPFRQPSAGVSSSGADGSPSANPAQAAQTKPDSSPSAVCARQGKQYDNGKCHEKCTDGTTWDGKKCAKQDEQAQPPQVPPPGGGEGGNQDKNAQQGGSKAGSGNDGDDGKSLKSCSMAKCSSSSGICGDTAEEKKKGEELTKYKQGLQPGDPQSQPPTEGGTPPDEGKLGSVQTRNPSAAQSAAQGGISKTQQAAGEFNGVNANPKAAETSSLNGSFNGIKGADLKAASLPVQKRINSEVSAMEAALQKAKAAGGEMAQTGAQAGQAVTQAIAKTQAADGASVSAARALKEQTTKARTVSGEFKTENSAWTACQPAPPTDPQGIQCRTPHNTKAGSVKSGFNPEPAAQQGAQARTSAEQAAEAVSGATCKLKSVQPKIAAFKSALSKARAAVSQVASTASSNTIPGDPNAAQRKSALQSIVQGGNESIRKLETIKTGTFDPGLKEIQKALDETEKKLNEQ
jgi:hypothetical protein